MAARLIDADCAIAGQAIAKQGEKAPKDLANHINKSIGVLVEDGVYAFFLYQKVEAKQGKSVIAGLREDDFLGRLGFDKLIKATPVAEPDFKEIAEATRSLSRLLFLREILERALIYARYQLKGMAERAKIKEKGGVGEEGAFPPGKASELLREAEEGELATAGTSTGKVGD